MNRYTEILNLDAEDVRRIGTTYAGYAVALIEQSSENKQPVIGSSWLIAALFQSLTDPKGSVVSFSNATLVFMRLGWPLWRLCAICSAGPDDFETIKENRISENANEEAVFYRLLQEAYFRAERRDTVSEYPEQQGVFYLSGYVPGLNIPYRLVLSAIFELEQLGANNEVSLNYFFVLLSRLGELFETYKLDSYHWQHLEGPILPFEPVALAIAVVFVKIWLSRRPVGDLRKIFETVGSQQTILLQVAIDLINQRSESNYLSQS